MPTRRIWEAFMVSPTADRLSDARLGQHRLCSPFKVDRVLHVTGFPSRHGPPHHTHGTESQGTEVLCDARNHSGAHFFVPHEAPASHGHWPGLELGLDKEYCFAQRRGGREDAFERDRQGDEREVSHQKVGVEREIFACQVAHVGPLHNSDAWIVAQGPVELAVADVDGEHPLGPPLQEGVGKSSRRCSGIEAGTSLYPHAELADGGVQFLAGARDEAFVLGDGDGLAGGDVGAYFGYYPVAHAHAAGEDQTLRPAPALGEAPLDEQSVQSLPAPFRATLHAWELAP